jgi:UDPglucose 6-dehydrogenase
VGFCFGGRHVYFAFSPENLRLGKAIEAFTRPDRAVIGVRDARAREIATELFRPITDRLEWMGVESAEMTKHAVNAFLAASVTFINELAALCEQVGADAKDVERGLKTERRIGPAAYLSQGAAFTGGTLA